MRQTRRRFAQLCTSAAVLGPAVFRVGASNEAIGKAIDAVRARIATAESDPERPAYHFHAPAQWTNDPNGTIFYKGWHHLFYQLNPFDSKWGHMHWGHARSRDLVNWEHLPIALWPSLEKGEEHVFSGCATLGPDGRPRLLYTSIGNRKPEQWLALPVDDDLIAWKKYEGNPVATEALHGDFRIDDWRDPFVFREAGKAYMVTGGHNNPLPKTPAVYLYQALNEEMSKWKYLGPVFEYRSRRIANIECPNLFELGARWVLLMSPQNPCEYFVGDLDLNRRKFVPDTYGVLDPGTSYASNISFDDRGRCILWLWGRTETEPQKGWNSAMVLPRILTIGDDGYLRQNPAPEFQQLRGERRTAPAAQLNATTLKLTDTISGDSLEIQASFTLEGAKRVGLRVRCPASGSGFDVGYGANAACSFPPDAGNSFNAGNAALLLDRGKQIRMRVFLDKRVVEAYANDGDAAIFTTVTAQPTDIGIEAYAEGGAARLNSFEAWPIKPAQFNLDRFRA